MVIDEIQRAPDLLLAIKSGGGHRPATRQVPADRIPGCSPCARCRTPCPAAWRSIELWPFSQGEIDDQPDGFIDAIFAHGPQFRHTSELARADYANRLIARRLSRGRRPRQPEAPTALFRFLRRRPDQPRCDATVGDRAHRRAPRLTRMLAARSGQRPAVQSPSRTSPTRHDHKPVRRAPRRGLPDQAGPGLVEEHQQPGRITSKVAFADFRRGGQPPRRRRPQPPAQAWAARSGHCSKASS